MVVLSPPQRDVAPSPPTSSSWPLQLAFALALALSARLSYFIYGWWRLYVALPYPRLFHGNWEELAPSPSSPNYVWLAPWEHLDALWYKEIALAGYQPGTGSVHFPPLFPFLAHVFSPVFGGSFGFAGMFVNLVAALAGFYLLQRLAALEGRAADGRRAALYMVAYPLGFFLFAPFTEATFFALSVASLYCARRGWWWWAGTWGFFATLARWQGALLAPALLVEYVLQWWPKRRRRKVFRLANLSVLAVALPGVAYLLFTLFARYVVHELATMGEINIYWGIQWLPPWEVIRRGIAHIDRFNDGVEMLNLLAIVGATLATLVGLRYLPFSLVVYMAGQVLFATTHVSAISPLASSARYMLTLFPAFLLLGRAGANPRLHQALVLFFFLIQGIFVWQFAAGEWVA